MNLQLIRNEEHQRWLRSNADQVRTLMWLVPVAIAAIAIASAYIENIWYRMGIANLVILPLALIALRLPLRELLRVRMGVVAAGWTAAAVMYLGGLAVFTLLPLFLPDVGEQSALIFGWKGLLAPLYTLPILCFVVFSEELFWRAGVTLPLAGKLGAWKGALLSALLFAIAHIALGSPLLVLAALVAGLFLNLLLITTRSLVASFICHLLWDVAVLYVWPYG